MKVVVFNLGCKVNQYESDCIVNSLSESGYDVSESLEFADYYILNTCAVTNEAEKKSRQTVSKCRKMNPNAKILICGCASQNNSAQFEQKENVTFISGVAGKNNLYEKLNSAGLCVYPLPNNYEENNVPLSMRTRAYLKVQDGCNNFCSYCLIPYLRGRSRSRTIDSVKQEIDILASKTKEIVLTGINLSAYGKDIGLTLTDLIESLISLNVRIRLGSLEMFIITEDFLQATMKLKNFCPQFHLSLQSGSDNILKKMNRHYNTNDFMQNVNLVRKYYPLASITTDIICGFPTETEEEFAQTISFAEQVEFSNIHCFGYSQRKGTQACNLQQVDNIVISERVEKLSQLARNLQEKYTTKFIGKTLEVLFEEKDNEVTKGYSKEYIKVYGAGETGTLKSGAVKSLYKDGAIID